MAACAWTPCAPPSAASPLPRTSARISADTRGDASPRAHRGLAAAGRGALSNRQRLERTVRRRALAVVAGIDSRGKRAGQNADSRNDIVTTAPGETPVTVPDRGPPNPAATDVAGSRGSSADVDLEESAVSKGAAESADGGKSAGNSSSSAEDIGQEIARLRELRRADGADLSGKQGFWSGVWQETQLIEWPVFMSVLGTTGVVLGIIVGSSVVLLTLNAVLAQTSDAVFANPVVKEFWRL